jgi:hypothetical protein
MPAYLNQGLTDLRDAVKAKVTHVGVSTDTTAFNATQTAIDPANVGSTNNLIKSATKTDVDFQTFDATMTISGDTEFTNKAIGTIASLKGSTRTDAMNRIVRSQTIGVQAGDTFTIGVRHKQEDNSL